MKRSKTVQTQSADDGNYFASLSEDVAQLGLIFFWSDRLILININQL